MFPMRLAEVPQVIHDYYTPDAYVDEIKQSNDGQTIVIVFENGAIHQWNLIDEVWTKQ